MSTKAGKSTTVIQQIPDDGVEVIQTKGSSIKRRPIAGLIIAVVVIFVFFAVAIWLIKPAIATCPQTGCAKFWPVVGMAAVATVLLTILLAIILKMCYW